MFNNKITRKLVLMRWTLTPPPGPTLMYADDSLLLAPSPAALQILIDICSQYFTSHRFVINYKKI